MKLAANLSMMFTEQPFLDRFAAAAAYGFQGVEFLFPYDHDPGDLARVREAAGVDQALFNLPPGDWTRGERGLAALKGRESDFEAALAQALKYAAALKTPRLHVMAGLTEHGAEQPVYIANLKRAAREAERADVTLCIEPINHRDVPGYFLNTTAQAMDTIEAVGSNRVRLQLDLYHLQITEGDISTRTRDLFHATEHVQIAGVPDRHEPDLGEVNIHHMLGLLDSLGYRGWVGCEYRPEGQTEEGLGWAAQYGITAL